MLIMKKILFILLAFPVAAVQAQDSQTRNVSGFHAIGVSGSYNVYVKKGNTESLRMKGNEETLDKIKTEVKGGTLKIYNDEKWWDWWRSGRSGRVDIYITFKELDELALSGSGKIVAEDELGGRSVDLSLSGSGNISAPVSAGSVGSHISGSGGIEVSGRADRVAVHISGSGNYSGRKLAAKAVQVHISGSGNAAVHADEELDARISGSGNVRYTGSPSRKNVSSSGSGKAIAAN